MPPQNIWYTVKDALFSLSLTWGRDPAWSQ